MAGTPHGWNPVTQSPFYGILGMFAAPQQRDPFLAGGVDSEMAMKRRSGRPGRVRRFPCNLDRARLVSIRSSVRRTMGKAMKALVVANIVLIMVSLAVWPSPAAAQKRGAPAPRVETADNGLGLPPPGSSGRNYTPAPGPLAVPPLSGPPYRNICRAENGINCLITSGRRALDDEICHCGPYHGVVLGTSQ